jgi:HEAT repeat protein
VIADLGCREAAPALIGLLQGDLREVRRAAIQALASIGGDEALRELRLRISDRDGHVRSAALAALGGLGDRESFDAVLARLDVENYPDVLEQAVRTLLRIDAPALFGRCETLTPAVRELVARSTDDVEMLLSLSRDGDQAVRLAALAGLGRTTDGRARTRLSEALQDPAPGTRKTAVAALGALNCAPADLRGALRDEDLWVRLSAVRVVGDSDSPEAAREIIPLLSDRAAPVVLAAVDALVRLGRTDVPELEALRNHPDEGVRERAAVIRE